MKMKLKLASRKDKKPTINAGDLAGLNAKTIIVELRFPLVNNCLITSSFHLSRNGKTYYADKWVGPLPIVGKPLTCELVSYTVTSEVHKQFKLEL